MGQICSYKTTETNNNTFIVKSRQIDAMQIEKAQIGVSDLPNDQSCLDGSINEEYRTVICEDKESKKETGHTSKESTEVVEQNNVSKVKERDSRRTISVREGNFINRLNISKLARKMKGYAFRSFFKKRLRHLMEKESEEALGKLMKTYLSHKNEHFLEGYPEFKREGWKELGVATPTFQDDEEGIEKMKFSSKLHYEKEGFYIGTTNILCERSGYGTLYVNDNFCYKLEGHWRKNHLNGWGRLYDSECSLYEGFFTKSKLQGHGLKIKLNGETYFGEFVDNLKCGHGKETNDEYEYEGGFVFDKKQGKGKIVFKITGDMYEGEFRNNEISGNGIYEWSNKNVYNGSFLNGKMNGKGFFKWSDGSSYRGEYKDGVKEGFGVFVWPSGKYFEGSFYKGVPHGSGILSSETGDRREVEFFEGKFVK